MADYGIEKMLTVIERVLELTKDAQIKWSASDSDETFLYTMPSTSIAVGTLDGDGRAPYFVRVHDATGRVVDSIKAEMQGDEGWKRPTEGFDLVEELFQRAQRSATDTDAVLDLLLDELPKKPPPAKDPWATSNDDTAPF